MQATRPARQYIGRIGIAVFRWRLIEAHVDATLEVCIGWRKEQPVIVYCYDYQ